MAGDALIIIAQSRAMETVQVLHPTHSYRATKTGYVGVTTGSRGVSSLVVALETEPAGIGRGCTDIPLAFEHEGLIGTVGSPGGAGGRGRSAGRCLGSMTVTAIHGLGAGLGERRPERIAAGDVA